MSQAQSPLLPSTNADGLPVVPMTDAQEYVFELKGWLLLPGPIPDAEPGPVREHLHALIRDRTAPPPHLRHESAGPGEPLIDHPAIVGVMNEVISHQPV